MKHPARSGAKSLNLSIPLAAALAFLFPLGGEEHPAWPASSTRFLPVTLLFSGTPSDPGEESAGTNGREPESPRAILGGHITASAWLAGITGSLQTPRGGGAGTTSPDRPTLEEVGLQGYHWLPLIDAGLTFFEKHQLHISYFRLDLEGQAVLKEDLVSQGETFPAGSAVESKLQLDLLRFGYRPMWLRPELGTWSLVPEIGMSFSPFTYQLQSETATGPVDRSYNIGFPYLALLLKGPIMGPLGAELELAGFAGINGVVFVDADLRLVQTLLRQKQFGADLVLSLKGTWIRRTDGQSPLQNDPNLRMGIFSEDPWGGFTFGLRFVF